MDRTVEDTLLARWKCVCVPFPLERIPCSALLYLKLELHYVAPRAIQSQPH